MKHRQFLKPAKRAIRLFVNKADELFSRSYLSLRKEKNSLMTFLFHSLFSDLIKADSNIMRINPGEAVTVNNFREFVSYYLQNNYVFISPDDILAGLDNNKKYVLITFDDGYYNNHLALPVLQEFNVPAVFFPAVHNVKSNQGFWWDILWRERRRQGMKDEAMSRERIGLRAKTPKEIIDYIIKMFGSGALKPIGDFDRPFTPKELWEFSKEKLVYIGNHTVNHIDLGQCSIAETRNEILNAQNELFLLTGRHPSIIAYPWGNFSPEVISEARTAGLQLGCTVLPGKNYLPLNLVGEHPFLLKRFVLSGSNILRQCEVNRSDMHISKG